METVKHRGTAEGFSLPMDPIQRLDFSGSDHNIGGMKRFFCLAGLLALPPAAQAHESWAPHTHTLGSRHSDLLVLCVAGLAVFSAGLLLLRSLGKRRGLKSSRVTSRRR